MEHEEYNKSIEMRVGALEQMFGQILAEQMANANGGCAAGMNVPVMPIIGGSVNESAWMFDPGAAQGEPHWKNTFIQLGISVGQVTQGINDSEDGQYYVDVDITDIQPTTTLRHGESVPDNTATNLYIYVGTVENGVQTDGIYTIPYVFMYL